MNTFRRIALCGCLSLVGCASDPAPPARAPVPEAKAPARAGSRVQVTEPQIVPTVAPQQSAGGPTPEQEASRIRLMLLRQVEDHYPELTECYDRGRDHDGALSGRVSVRFTVAPSGDVVGLSDGGGTTMVDRTVVSCVQGAFTRMKFKSWDGKAVSAMLPIDFSSPQ